MAGLMALALGVRAADFIEIKGARELDNIRVAFDLGQAYHTALQVLPRAEAVVAGTVGDVSGKSETGYYVGYALSANLTKEGIKGTVLGNLLEGFIDFAAKGEAPKQSPVFKKFETTFSIKKPGKEWTKVVVDKSIVYEVRWVTE